MMRQRFMVRQAPVIFLLILILLLTGCNQPRGSVAGQVLNEEGTPATNVAVRAEQSGQPAAIFWVEDNGSFTLRNVRTGTWTIEYYSENGNGLGREKIQVGKDTVTEITFTIGTEPAPEDMPKLLDMPPKSAD